MRKLTGFEIAFWLLVALIAIGIVAVCRAAMTRYPVGQPVPHEVYTAPFDPCDPIYKFIAPAPPDWAERFGDNERTCLIHAISELRVVVAAQSKRILALEEWQKKRPQIGLPPEIEKQLDAMPADELMSFMREIFGLNDPNEGKK